MGIQGTGDIFIQNSTQEANSEIVTDHGALEGLLDDDHTQYAKSTGAGRVSLSSPGTVELTVPSVTGGAGEMVLTTRIVNTSAPLFGGGQLSQNRTFELLYDSGDFGVDGSSQLYLKPEGHNHDTAYAPIAKGVTNGDSHDHSGGDGAQIAYSTLSGLPSLGDSASKNVGTTAGTVAAGDDSRLVTGGDSHDHNGGDGAQIAYATLSGLPTLGDCASKNVGTSAGTVAAGDDSRFVTNGDSHDHSGGDGAQVSYASLSGLPTLGDAASKNVGTTAGTVAAGNDSRFVTNGNSHDHNGGDGAQIAYSTLSGLPTLGDAASKNVGTAAGTVAAGNDSRFVTNGNSHDHNGGDGGQVSYDNLSDLPVLRYAQTMTDDSVWVIDFGVNVYSAIALISMNSAIASSCYGMIHFRATSGAFVGAVSMVGTANFYTSALAGTTGADASLNFACVAGKNKLYIENRLGASRSLIVHVFV